MGLFGLFNSSEKAVDTASYAVKKGVDVVASLFYTDADKAAAASKYFEDWRDFQKILASEALPSALSRRILAWIISGVFCGMVLLGILVYKFDQEWSKFIFDQGVERLSFGFGAVITTYFVTGGIAKVLAGNKSDSK